MGKNLKFLLAKKMAIACAILWNLYMSFPQKLCFMVLEVIKRG
jgi:hypothetical protein